MTWIELIRGLFHFNQHIFLNFSTFWGPFDRPDAKFERIGMKIVINWQFLGVKTQLTAAATMACRGSTFARGKRSRGIGCTRPLGYQDTINASHAGPLLWKFSLRYDIDNQWRLRVDMQLTNGPQLTTGRTIDPIQSGQRFIDTFHYITKRLLN